MSKPSIEQVIAHCDLPGVSCLDVEIHEKYFDDIVKYLSEWESLARKFEIDVCEINESCSKVREKRILFLKAWKSKNSVNATYKELVTNLWKSDDTEAAKNICQVYKSKFWNLRGQFMSKMYIPKKSPLEEPNSPSMNLYGLLFIV